MIHHFIYKIFSKIYEKVVVLGRERVDGFIVNKFLGMDSFYGVKNCVSLLLLAVNFLCVGFQSDFCDAYGYDLCYFCGVIL